MPAQTPPQKDKPRIDVAPLCDGEFWRLALVVRDPGSGTYRLLTREDGVPILKGHIEFHVKKLQEAKDDKAVRDAL